MMILLMVCDHVDVVGDAGGKDVVLETKAARASSIPQFMVGWVVESPTTVSIYVRSPDEMIFQFQSGVSWTENIFCATHRRSSKV